MNILYSYKIFFILFYWLNNKMLTFYVSGEFVPSSISTTYLLFYSSIHNILVIHSYLWVSLKIILFVVNIRAGAKTRGLTVEMHPQPQTDRNYQVFPSLIKPVPQCPPEWKVDNFSVTLGFYSLAVCSTFLPGIFKTCNVSLKNEFSFELGPLDKRILKTFQYF